ncbi:MAG: class I tRNA ligase family protein [Patescibacteria group bacterium]
MVVSHEDPLRLLRHYYGANSVGISYATEFSLDVGIRDLHRPMIDSVVMPCEKCGGAARRVTEIFDSWVEAGSMPFAEYHYPFENKEIFKKRYPGQFIAEYIAQTRAWFYVLHVISQVLFGKAPVQNLVTTGNMLSEDGSKMSKSKNNFPDPWLTINKYGADSLRFYLMNAVVMQADDQNFAVKDLENIHRKVPMILWNVFNYFATYAREAKWRVSSNTEPLTSNILDRWILARTQELVNGATEHLDGYDTVRATRTIMDYIDDLSTWYLRRSRGRADGAFFSTLHEALLAISTVIAPIMPHLAEIIYLNLAEFGGAVRESVHLAPFPAVRDLTGEEKKLLRAMAVVREAASAGQAARKALNIPVRQPLARCAVELTAKDVELDEALLAPLLFELNVRKHDPALMKERGDAVHVSPGTKDVANVYLDTALTDQLKLEGLARGFERCVQEARKQAGFSVGEKATLTYETAAEDFLRAMEFFDAAKTYSAELEKGIKEGAERFAYESEGKKIEFALRRT